MKCDNSINVTIIFKYVWLICIFLSIDVNKYVRQD